MLNNNTVSTGDSTPVSYARHSCVGVIRIANPPVNALGQAVRQGIVDALQQALADDDAEVIVLLAAGRTFIAGADIREFGKPPQAPQLSEVVAALETSAKPLIAVLHGTALGGGLEVALGCHLRIALEGTRIGLPEVKLGLLPGAGGTQRLPRLAGVAVALDIITSGRFVPTDEALRHGILDDVVDSNDPLTAGLAAAEQLLAGHYTPRNTGALPAPEADTDAIQRCCAQLERDVAYLYSPFRCVEAIEASTRLPFAEGLKRERELFMQCMDSPQRAGMIHAFFAARGTHKVPGTDSDITLTTLGLLGWHPLFEAIATHAAKAKVTLINLNDTTDSQDDIQACLVAPDVNNSQRQQVRDSLPLGALMVEMGTPHAPPAQTDATLVLPPRDVSQPICELVDRSGNAVVVQALANTLKQLKHLVVVTRNKSVIATLNEALRAALTEVPELQATAWQSQGWDLSPWLSSDVSTPHNTEAPRDSQLLLDLAWQQAAAKIVQADQVHRHGDIDVLAIHAFGYPTHLGGPSFRSKTSR
ncbi:3-hydroxyacyl-CoA dehydrogenase [Modicisalibacter xianhensis]|uniref:3-hydroxyacyl-CoA dehydrogenase n=1 Tax=Modicisalibacter xianhensis TaxID=442341 RepID=A0A4R8FKK8_9GAMM|nr:enoyl-CoA hydratase/isomerase family protein [Halomonas xianhensis]TDX26739.1 3-hydroxyacyl-CoA dehydrogenase [Halomonas xianhensis]